MWVKRGCRFVIATVLVAVALAGEAATLAADMEAALRRGGHVLLVRHAQTEAGIGDPPGFKLEDCRTQRNLSAAGRDQARALGEAIRARGLPIGAVRSSQWCRCLETARLAFADQLPVEAWPALNSFFNDAAAEAGRSAALQTAMRQLPAGTNVVWVTHQVNITAVTGVVPSPGEIVIVRPGAAGPVLVGRWIPD